MQQIYEYKKKANRRRPKKIQDLICNYKAVNASR